MRTEALRAFQAVAAHSSFTAAAAELSLSQSAMSRQIRALESDLGVRLFARSTQSVALTPAGEALLAEVPTVLEAAAAALQAARPDRARWGEADPPRRA